MNTHIKKILAISLVVVMCLSTLPMLAMIAPPASAAAGDANNSTIILARATDHDAVWDYTPTPKIGKYSHELFEWNGLMVTNIGNAIASSTDAMTWETMHTAPETITGCYVHQGAIYYSYDGHLMRSTDGVTWTEVLSIGPNQRGVSWSWDACGDKIIFGTYGEKSNETSAYLSTDNGLTWDRVFHIQAMTDEYHTHAVAIDPYYDWLYVNVGDGDKHRGLYVSKDLGSSWVHLPAQGPFAGINKDVSVPMNGFLAFHHVDADHMIWYADNIPTGWMLDKVRMEMVKVVDMTDVKPYLGVDSYEFWTIAEGSDLTYLATRDYINLKAHIYASADGVVWYLIQEVPYVTHPTISVVNGRLYYSGGGSWRDVPMDEYLDSIATVWSIDALTLPRNVPIIWPVNGYYNVTMRAGNDTNAILNPSMEDVDGTSIVSWGNLPIGSMLDAPSTSPIARDGSRSLYFHQDWMAMEEYPYSYRYVGQSPNTYLEPGEYVLRFSVRSNATSPDVYNPKILLYIDDVLTHQFRHSVALTDIWIDHVYYFRTDGGTLTKFIWQTYDSAANYHLDRVSISQTPYYSASDLWDPPGSPLSINGQPVQEGVVHLQAGDTIMLTKGYATVSFGEADAPAPISDTIGQYAWLIVAAVGVLVLAVYAVAARHPLVLIVGIGLLLIAALLKTGVL